MFGIPDRGRLEPGCAADLMLFDPATVARGPKRRGFDLPAGAARLMTPAVGLHGVWVNGQRVADAKGRSRPPPRAGTALAGVRGVGKRRGRAEHGPQVTAGELLPRRAAAATRCALR